MTEPLDGHVAVVTGASRGIGKAVALALASAGCDVVVCARTRNPTPGLPGSLTETGAAIEALGRRALIVEADLTRTEDIATLHGRTVEHFGRSDILVNNAALQLHFKPALTDGVASLDAAYALNLRAPVLASQLFGRTMAGQGSGVILNVSSPSARLPGPPGAATRRPPWSALAYGTTKAALDRFSQGLAHELFESKVAVVTVYPGFTRTELLETNPPPGVDQARAEPPDMICKAIVQICTAPMAYTGRGLTWRDVLGDTR